MLDKSQEIETRADQRLLSSETQKTSYRKARRERISAGKADTFDCWSEEDVVCPYCGAWFDGATELGEVINRWLREDRTKLWHEVPCQECRERFMVRVELRFNFTTKEMDR